MDDYEMDHMEGALMIWQQRLETISAEDVVRTMN